MLEYIVIGGGLAFTAAIQPGPLQAYLLSRVAAIGWKRTLPAVFAPLVSDGPIATIVLLILGQLSIAMQSALRVAGGLLLFYLAWRTFNQWRRFTAEAVAPLDKTPRTLFEAALVNLLNPNPWLGWALILGPIVVSAWRQSPGASIAVVISFYLTMITMLALSVVAFGGARAFGAGFQRILLLLSAVVLAAFGMYQLGVGLQYFVEQQPVSSLLR